LCFDHVSTANINKNRHICSFFIKKMLFFSLRKHKNKAEKCVFRLKMFENRDIVWKIREITDFKHKIMYYEQSSFNLGVPLHQKKILMVKVYG